MNKVIILALLAIILTISNCAEVFKCNQEPINQEPNVINQKVLTYVLKEKIVHNSVLSYDTFRAQKTNDNTAITVKLYLRPQPNSDGGVLENNYWTYSDSFADPDLECNQMKAIMSAVRDAKINVKFEECLDNDAEGSQGDGTSQMVVNNAFLRANGEPLSNACISDNCRTKLQKISTLLLQGLEVLAGGIGSSAVYYVVNEITPDNIYYFDMGPEKYLTFTDMKYNAVPQTEQSQSPWLADMNKVGEVLAKLLARNCEFIISEESKKSSLMFYKQVHQLDNYDHNDVDVGVNPMILSSQTQDPDTKKQMLNDSLYDFILKLLTGANQFTNPSMALKHNFITKAASTRIDRPSDMS